MCLGGFVTELECLLCASSSPIHSPRALWAAMSSGRCLPFSQLLRTCWKMWPPACVSVFPEVLMLFLWGENSTLMDFHHLPVKEMAPVRIYARRPRRHCLKGSLSVRGWFTWEVGGKIAGIWVLRGSPIGKATWAPTDSPEDVVRMSMMAFIGSLARQLKILFFVLCSQLNSRTRSLARSRKE